MKATTEGIAKIFWLPRSSVGARADAPASRGRTGRWSDRTAFPRWSVGTRGKHARRMVETDLTTKSTKDTKLKSGIKRFVL